MFSSSPADPKPFRRWDPAHTSHTGLRILQREIYRDWEIRIEHYTTGMTLRRQRYSAQLVDAVAKRVEYLRGFATSASALQAARRRIDLVRDACDLSALRQRHFRRRVRER